MSVTSKGKTNVRKRTFTRVRMVFWLVLLAVVTWVCVDMYWEGAPPTMTRIAARMMPEVRDEAIPDVERRTYRVAEVKKQYTYMVQVPLDVSSEEAEAYVVFMHGAGSNESQGLGFDYNSASIRRLRAEVAKRGWIYVVPRRYEFAGLLEELAQAYGEKPVYLVGVSKGGAEVLDAARSYPDRYAGVIALCPARPRPLSWYAYVRPFEMPVYLANGEKDGMRAVFTRDLARKLESQGKRFYLMEVIDGDHSAPVDNIDWKEAFDFVVGGEE